MHFHVYGRTRTHALVTCATFWTRAEANTDMREWRAGVRNGIEFRGCVTFHVRECPCPEGARMVR